MRQIALILFLILFSITFSGCSYLGSKSSMDSFTEDTDESFDSDEDDEDYEEYEKEEHPDETDEDKSMDEDYEEIEEDYEEYGDEDEDEEGDEDEEDEDEDEEGDEDDEDEDADESGGFLGFFKNLFGGDDHDNLAEEIIDDEEGYEEEDEGSEYVESNEEESILTDKNEEVVAEQKEDQIDMNLIDEASSSTTSLVTTPPVKKNIPLQKIKTAAYQSGSQLVNAVYVARQGDSLKKISQIIYQSDRTQDLYAINSYLKSRSVKVGDKIYYNSPYRPNDNTRMFFYYEDIGVSPSLYNLKSGDNIRKVSTQLLGHANSWKEIWTTNSRLKSKDIISTEITISYWPEKIETPPQKEEPQMVAETQEPNPMELDSMQGGQELAPIEEMTPPLPEAPSLPDLIGINEKIDLISSLMKDKKEFMGIGGFFLLIILMLRAIIRKRRKESEFDYTAVTNVNIDK